MTLVAAIFKNLRRSPARLKLLALGGRLRLAQSHSQFILFHLIGGKPSNVANYLK